MKAIKFLGQNTIFAKDQPEYKQLPAYAANGAVTTCWQLSDKEVKHIAKTRTIELTVLTFNRFAQPISVSASRPSIPLNPRTKIMANPHTFDEDTATFKIVVIPMAMEEITKNKLLWITTITYGSALQPIQGRILPSLIIKP